MNVKLDHRIKRKNRNTGIILIFLALWPLTVLATIVLGFLLIYPFVSFPPLDKDGAIKRSHSEIENLIMDECGTHVSIKTLSANLIDENVYEILQEIRFPNKKQMKISSFVYSDLQFLFFTITNVDILNSYLECEEIIK